jgi:hypothetical protein
MSVAQRLDIGAPEMVHKWVRRACKSDFDYGPCEVATIVPYYGAAEGVPRKLAAGRR